MIEILHWLMSLFAAASMASVPQNTGEPYAYPCAEPDALGVASTASTTFYGLSFDGGDYCDLPYMGASGNISLTFRCWFKWDGADGGVLYHLGRSGTAYQGVGLKITNATTLEVFHWSRDWAITVPTLGTGWHYIAHTRQSGVQYVILDGTVYGPNAAPSLSIQANDRTALCSLMAADGSAPSGSQPPTGIMTQVAFHTAYIPTSTLLANKASPAWIGDDCAGFYQMQPGSGSVMTDGSGNGRDGALGAGASEPTWVGSDTALPPVAF